ncbi:MAG: hypothetical protein H6970_08990 [Gammaproteobacteria bacterium]|nr:hypothetical protein [Gammaproteobacteria bacterium]
MQNYKLIVLGSLILAPTLSFAVDWDAALGGGVGGAVGAAVGSEVGGRNGAIVGGAVGGAVGTAITTRNRSSSSSSSYYRESETQYRAPSREVIYVDPPRSRGFCPPGHAKKGEC